MQEQEIQRPLSQAEKWEEFKRLGRNVMVDLDGTLVRFSYPDLGPPLPGARKFMRELIRRGLRPIIYTSRMSSGIYTEEERAATLAKIGRWLNRHKIPYDSIDTGNSGKPVALAYVDDRGVSFNGNYDRCLRRIEAIRERESARFDEGDDDG